MSKAHSTINDLESLCKVRGVRLTKQRRETFLTLRDVGKPISAYDLLARLEEEQQRKLAPLTVYRTLDFLVECGLVHKISSTHCYVACDHPHDEHESVHLICSECGSGEELAIPEIKKALDLAAKRSSFLAQRQIVEVKGLCRDCSTLS
jgi:Fur family zinc uptake transcriptional regulator